jgi:hypothetical protein
VSVSRGSGSEDDLAEGESPCAIAGSGTGGRKKAIVAVAHAILVTAYHLPARQIPFEDPGADYYDRRHAERVRHRAIQTLERQGYRVTLEPAA